MLETKRYWFGALLGCALLLVSHGAWAASDAAVDVDALYAQAAAASQRGDRNEARRLAVEVLVRAPNYADATVLLARLDGWEGRYDPARDALVRVIEEHPENMDARKALIDVEYWSGRHDRATELCTKTGQLLPDDDELRASCAQVARAVSVETADVAVVARQRTSNPKKKLDAEVPATYRASVDYTNQSFDSGPSSWNTVALASERRDERVALIGRASYVNRYNESMLQLDAEAYPTLGEQTYAHLLTSYATGDILHDFKLWGEIYQGLPQKMEGSLGVRWSVYDDDVVSFTGSLGHYWQRWFFQGRFVVDTVSGESASSGILRARYSMDDPEDSITTTLAYGDSIEQDEGLPAGGVPGDPLVTRLFEITNTTFHVEWRKRLAKRYVGKLSFGAEHQDFEESVGDDRTQFLVGIGLEHLF
jgi:YaiO family outer membrane protein